MTSPRILLLDDSSASLRALGETLQAQGFDVCRTAEPGEALAAIRDGCEVVLGEIHQAAESVLSEVRGSTTAPPLIVFDDFAGLGGPSSEQRAGIFDTLARPIADEDVLRSVRRALESHALRIENARLREVLDGRGDFGELVSRDPRMQRIFETLGSVADSRATLLLTGESGTVFDHHAKTSGHDQSQPEGEEAAKDPHTKADPAPALLSQPAHGGPPGSSVSLGSPSGTSGSGPADRSRSDDGVDMANSVRAMKSTLSGVL
jgi:DNA-binding NtrC family response regulator